MMIDYQKLKEPASSPISKMMISEQNDEVSDRACQSLGGGHGTTDDNSSNAAGQQKIIINP
jgi:hypothetical protein